MSSHFEAAQPECLMRLMEAAPQICRRHQFFVWTQGDLQRWLPHDLMVCGFYDRDARALVFDVFNSKPLPDEVVTQLREPPAGWAMRLVQVWQAARQEPVAVNLGMYAAQDGTLGALLNAGYSEVLLHGHCRPGRPDELESLFILARTGERSRFDQVAAMGMLLPCVHAAYQRVCVTERQLLAPRVPAAHAPAGARPLLITEREREILVYVRDGMSNHEIGERLGISALTVKNHVQKILRKLGAANRAQAVAKAMTLDVLGPAMLPAAHAPEAPRSLD